MAKRATSAAAPGHRRSSSSPPTSAGSLAAASGDRSCLARNGSPIKRCPAAASNDDDHLGRSRGGWRTSLPVVVGIAHPGYRSPKAEPREARALAKRGLA